MNTEHQRLASEKNVPLCVGLDGTLIRTNLLLEAVFILLKRNVFHVFQFPLWLFRGKAHFRQRIAERVEIEVDALPYNESFVSFLQEQKHQRRRLVLATAANRKYADQVARHLGFFDQVMASDSQTNLHGPHKRQRLVDAFGMKRFDYAGHGARDLEVWSAARHALAVDAGRGVMEKLELLVPVVKVFENHKPRMHIALSSMRLHQWVKNLIVFIPLIMAHQLDNPALLFAAVLAFLAFGLCASSAYLVNDLLDLPADRRHPGKAKRPLASGGLHIRNGLLLIPLLLILAMLVALFLPLSFIAWLTAYYALTLAYSLHLKQAPIIDVLTLAGLYTLRLLAGGAAVAVPLSFWLLAFSMFLFLSLALVKRYSELLALKPENNQFVPGRGYGLNDLEALAQFGSASGYLSVLVMALYINSAEVSILYTHPKLIWLLCPLLLFWISRVWLLARRNQMDDDPVVFATQDRPSRWVALVGVLILWIAI